MSTTAPGVDPSTADDVLGLPPIVSPGRLLGVRARVVEWAATTLGFTGLAVALTWPFARDVWGGRVDGDATQFVWDAWWVKERVFALQSPWWTGDLYAPEGTYLAAHPLETLVMVLVSPVTALAGAMVSYGVLVLATLVVAGLLMWRLGLAMGLGRFGAMVAGVLWMSSPIVLFKVSIGHFMLLLLAALLPATLILALRLARTLSTRRAAAVGLLLGASLLTDLQVTAYLVLATAAFGFYVVATRATWRSRAALRPVGVALATFLVVGSPTLVMTARAELDGEYRTPTAARVAWATAANADVAQFLLPSPASRFFGDDYDRAADRLGDLSSFTVDAAVALGWATTALALVGIVATLRSRRTWWLAGATVACLVLALGPNPKVLGHTYAPLAVDAGEKVSLVAPGTWLLAVPVVNDLRIPARYAQLGLLPLVLLAGLGAQALVLRRRAAGSVVVAGLCVLAVAEGAVAVPVVGLPGERLAKIVRDDPRAGIVVDVPVSWRSGIDEIGAHEVSPRAMLQQVTHGKPIAAGYVARVDHAMYDRLLERPLYRALLLRQGNGEVPPGVDDPSREEAIADARGIGANWVVVWPEADRALLPFLAELGYRRVADDGGVLLYSRTSAQRASR